ncbi:expressed protein [Batrachochytrium dendrobatidis JAM81]|uniref:Expressed protein n=1 Tax=Batrachochytrium dendrobatidis (strain JAM81 / FGSC 10211) TaxID=684364 RepID=F4PBK4_BATDJ|nr:uncharacterized protein BATDEDRAFT_37437 [Batrachochytrium dendrobatidis JAM81]EGF77339.1 expressed protein [Batrachochytrium dendrobatidis JAM81]|eukprot:XP_006682017.1 expressed protein [Batrachochytrium dendrobatidis JAM81]
MLTICIGRSTTVCKIQNIWYPNQNPDSLTSCSRLRGCKSSFSGSFLIKPSVLVSMLAPLESS